MFFYINVYTTYVKGEIKKIGVNERNYTEITIGEKTYELIKNPLGDSINIGDSGILYITGDEKGAVFEKGFTTGSQLGVLINTYIADDVGERVGFKIYTDGGKLVKPIGALKIKIDGKTYKVCSEIIDVLKQGTDDIPVQPIIFSYNENGELNTIDTPYNIHSSYDGMEPSEVRPTGNESETGLRRLIKGSMTYFTSQQSFNGKMNLSNATKIFNIPADPKKASEREFSMASSNNLVNTKSYSFDAYSSTESGVVADIVIMDAGSVAASKSYGVVNNIETTYDVDTDEITTKLTVTQWNRSEKLYTADLTMFSEARALDAADDQSYRIEKGDFIAYSASDMGEVMSVNIIVDASESDPQLRYKGGSNPLGSNFDAHNRLLYGKVGENYNGILSIIKDTGMEVCNANSFRIYKCTQIDKNTLLEKVSASDIFDVKSYGEDANYVIIFTDYAEARIMVVY